MRKKREFSETAAPTKNMHERSLRELVTVGVVAIHVVSGLLAMCLFIRFNLKEELKSVMAILAPIFMVSTTAIVTYYLKNMNKLDPGLEVTWVVTFLFITFFAAYSLVVLVSLIARAYYGRITPEELVMILGTSESIFGAFVTRIVLHLFQEERS